MDPYVKKTDDFLSETKMHPDRTDIAAVTDSILGSMRAGLTTGGEGLQMIPTYIGVSGAIPDGESVIALDAGGTNLRRAVVTWRGGMPVIENFTGGDMPGKAREITKDEFIEALADYILPLAGYSSKLAFCYSYPAEILPNRDARLVPLTKEIRISGLTDTVIGEELFDRLKYKGVDKSFSFTVLNDTVSTLLAGVAATAAVNPGDLSYAGLVFGTGCNMSYVERGENIAKLPDAKDMIINIEMGDFSGAPGGEFDRVLDLGSVNPGRYVYEKMLSGAYFGSVLSLTIRHAVRAGLLSETFAAIDTVSMRDADVFWTRPLGSGMLASMCESDGDTAVLHTIIDRLYERAARLICAAVSAIALMSDSGAEPWRPMLVTADGSMFYKSPCFRDKLACHIQAYLNRELGRHVSFTKVDNGNLIGAAAAAMLN